MHLNYLKGDEYNFFHSLDLLLEDVDDLIPELFVFWSGETFLLESMDFLLWVGSGAASFVFEDVLALSSSLK